MSKPLELTVYPRADQHTDHQGREWFWACQACSGLPDEYVTHEKRFTDAELAAEVWRQEAQVTAVEAMGGTPIRNIAALKIIHRFATLPTMTR